MPGPGAGMGPGLLADVILVLHVAFVAFVVLGQLAILIGLACGWRWVRNPWFRCLHLLAIAIVAGEAVFNLPCPLTVWEAELRHAAGQPVTGETFVGRLLHPLLFWDLGEPWHFNVLHIGFGLFVLVTFLLAPPRWRAAARRTG